jgi:hypothetical protein
MTINYVCLSDMHLGQDNSLLTNLIAANAILDHSSASPVMKALCDALRELIERANAGSGVKPVLILNGDILELALADVNDAAMVFSRFIECIMPKDNEIFSEIIYIPGNHDHHLWELARETQYVEYLKQIKVNDKLPAPWHTTSLFMDGKDPLSSYFLNGLVRRYGHLDKFSVKMAYPNLGLFDPNKQRYVIFHHGHYIERIYKLMTEVMSLIFPGRDEPLEIWDIEKENFAWIDFFWSTMGRSGGAGTKVEVIYEALPVEKARNRLISNLCGSLADKYDLPGLGDWMEEKILTVILTALANYFAKRERRVIDEPLSKDAREGLGEYLGGPLYRQLLISLKKYQGQSDKKASVIPNDITFVFGHTHKPYQDDDDFDGYPGWVDVYNTGGWVVESVQRQPIMGASVVLFDESLQSTSIRLYNESEAASDYRVRVIQASRKNPFHDRIEDLVKNTQQIKDKWDLFSKEAARAVDVRAKHLKAKLARTAG